MLFKENYPLKKLNTFGIDVYARYFAEVTNIEHLREVFRTDLRQKKSHLILGGGSNLLFTNNFDGLVIKVSLTGVEVISEDANHVVVKAAAGEDWDQFVSHCVKRGWGGLENLSMIPGQVGSSPIQNIGAYGAELKDCFESLEAFEKRTGKIITLNSEDCQFGYRTSIFKRDARNLFVILSVSFRLRKTGHVLKLGYGSIKDELQKCRITEPTIADIREVVCTIRRNKLPDPALTGNAGSFFKNPVLSKDAFEKIKIIYPDLVSFPDKDGVKLAAGWLVENAGWKAYRLGDAGVHPSQALVLVNYGNANGMEILNLSEKIKNSVLEKYGVNLEPEVNIVT